MGVGRSEERLEQVQQLSPSVLAEIVDRALRNVKERKVFAENLRNELVDCTSLAGWAAGCNFCISSNALFISRAPAALLSILLKTSSQSNLLKYLGFTVANW